MCESLRHFNMTPGIVGSLVVGFDGLVIEKDVMEGFDGPVMAAEAMQLASCLGDICRLGGIGEAESCVLQSEGGMLFAAPLPGIGWLVAFGDAEASIGPVRQAARSAVRDLMGALSPTRESEEEQP